MGWILAIVAFGLVCLLIFAYLRAMDISDERWEEVTALTSKCNIANARIGILEANATAEADALSRANARADGADKARLDAVMECDRLRKELAKVRDGAGLAVEALRPFVESRRTP